MQRRLIVLAAAAAALASACVVETTYPSLEGQDVRLTIVHTSDFHSRLLKYRFTPGGTDVSLGLDATLANNYGVGGMDRVAYVVKRERARALRSVHLDSGDGFQGAPIYNLWKGEPEYRVLSEIGLDAAVIGNHEFDSGAPIYASNVELFAQFPVLAANYAFEDYTEEWANTLGRVVQPFTVINAKGLRVGVIGMGNLDSLNSITDQGNSLGILPLETVRAAQEAVNLVRPYADLVVVVSHMGLDEDTKMAEQVRGIDVIMGGHLHIVLWPPKTVTDPDGRQVIIAHSGAFAKFVGRLDVVVRKPDDPALAAERGFEVLSHKFQVFPIDKRVDDEIAKLDKADHEREGAATVARVREILEPYQIEMARQLDLERTVGCSALDRLRRFGESGGDSAFGNLVAEAMQMHEMIEADFAITNSTGIRDDLRGARLEEEHPGACFTEDGQIVYSIALEELYNVLPFENTITTMMLSGLEVQELFDYIAWRTAERGCSSQAQISGARVTLVCGGDEHSSHPHADDISIGGLPVSPNGTYELATNDYIAAGGSGYDVLKRNTTQVNSYISMRDAVAEYMGRVGLVPCLKDDASFPGCAGTVPAAAVEDGRIQVRY